MKPKPLTVAEAKNRLDALVAVFTFAKSELDRGTATGPTWPVLAAKGLERWGEQLALAGKWLMYAANSGALFDERRAAIDTATTNLKDAEDARSFGTPDAAKALELEHAVIAARAALYHTHGSFPQLWSNIDNEVVLAEKSGRRVEYAFERAVAAMNGIEADRRHGRAREHFGILRAEARPGRKMRSEPFRKFADRILTEERPANRAPFAVVALEEVGRYRAEFAKFDADDRDRDANRKGSPMVDPPSPEEFAKCFARWFEHNESVDDQKAKLEEKAKAKMKAEQAAREAESAKRRAFLSSANKITSSVEFDAQYGKSVGPAPLDAAEHAKGAPPMPAPPPTSGRTA